MKKYFHAFAMCQSMFCALPSPWKLWDEEARDKMLLFLPLVGLEVGALWLFLAFLAAKLALPLPIRALVLCLWPYIAAGYIHLDGFMDVTDAIRSCRDTERRREILKDPHVGAFAVIGVSMLLLASYAVFMAGAEKPCGILLLVPAVSRCGSALAVTALKPMKTSQYAAQNIRFVLMLPVFVILFTALVVGFFLFGGNGFALVGGVIGYVLALRRGYHSLGGMNGDIAGYALTVSELASLLVWALI